MLTIEGKSYDFIDFGASKGGSIEFARRVLGGKCGLGIDISEDKLAYMKSLGYDCINADVTNLINIPDNSVRFVIISHLLEHLDSIDTIRLTIKEAYRVASDFVFIQGPYYDGDDYLESLGLRFYWSYWHGHTYHFRVSELLALLEDIPYQKHDLLLRSRITNSMHESIHPLESPIDQHEYIEGMHPPKPNVIFDEPVYREFVSFIAKKPVPNWELLIHAKKDCVSYKTREPIVHRKWLGTFRRLVKTLVWMTKIQSLRYMLNK